MKSIFNLLNHINTKTYATIGGVGGLIGILAHLGHIELVKCKAVVGDGETYFYESPEGKYLMAKYNGRIMWDNKVLTAFFGRHFDKYFNSRNIYDSFGGMPPSKLDEDRKLIRSIYKK